jgi:hypothetical protein
MTIALLGWGSLLWEGGLEFDKYHDDWKFDGPTLPIEFSRISQKRLGALTLVIDREHGVPTTVAWCLSTRRRLEDTIRDLQCREETTVVNIGRLEITETLPVDAGTQNEAAVDPLVGWAKNRTIDAVVWTALKSNFSSKTKCPFSAAAAISYVKTLPREGKEKAAEYVWRTPEFVQTPVRRALEQELWFSRAGEVTASK